MNRYKSGGLDRNRYVVLRRPEPGENFPLDRVVNVQAQEASILALMPTDDHVFPLRIDQDPHARRALKAYADSVREDNEQLAQDLLIWLEETHNLFLDKVRQEP